MGSIARRRRAGQTALWAAGLGAVACAGLGGVDLYRAHRLRARDHGGGTTIAAPTTNKPVATSTAPPPITRVVVTAPPRTEAAVHRNHPTTIAAPTFTHDRVAPPAAPLRVVDLVPMPKAVRVSLDGHALGDFGPALSRLTLPAGPHTITFENAACYPWEKTIAANDSPGPLIAHLRWKPSSLKVIVTPPSATLTADVLVDGKFAVRSGQSLPVAIGEQSVDGRREVQVKVSAPGFRSATANITVRAGQLEEHPIALVPQDGE